MVVDAVPGRVFEGKVDADQPGDGFRQRHVPRGLRIRQRSNELQSGMFGRIEVVYDQRDDALTVPRVALLEDEGEPALFVVRGSKAHRGSGQARLTQRRDWPKSLPA